MLSFRLCNLSTAWGVVIYPGIERHKLLVRPSGLLYFAITSFLLCLSTSQSDHVFIVDDLNINLLDPTAIENDFINSGHFNFLIPLINKPTPNANNNPSILDHIWLNQLYENTMVYFY